MKIKFELKDFEKYLFRYSNRYVTGFFLDKKKWAKDIIDVLPESFSGNCLLIDYEKIGIEEMRINLTRDGKFFTIDIS